MVWSEKYSPKKVGEVIGQKKQVGEFLKWYSSWKPGEKPVLLHGSPGTGKTCLTLALGNEKNLDTIEVNASDYRTAEQIKAVLGSSMKQQSLFKKGKIFLIDEIDGVAGREDKGGIKEIIGMVKETKHPVVLTANDIYNKKLSSLKKHCHLISFGKVFYYDMVKRLQHICEQEGIECDKQVLQFIAKKSDGDMRSAINDLETIAIGRKKVTMGDVEELGYREVKKSVFDALKMIFKTKTVMGAKMSLEGVDVRPDDILWWIETNIVNEYEKPEEIAEAYYMLAKADLFKNRISKNQEWRLLKYMIDLMTAGVALSKREMYRKFSKYQYPDMIKTLGSTKEERGKDKDRLLELADKLHCSTRKVKSEFMPFLRIIGGEKA